MPILRIKPSTVVVANNGSASPIWLVPTSGIDKDDITTGVAVRPFGNETKSKFLVFTNFGTDFDGAVISINSIKVKIWAAGLEYQANGNSYHPYILDDIVKLTKDGTTLIGSNLADTDYWPERSTYGNPHPNYPLIEYEGVLWGTTWSQAEVEASTFGFAISVKTDQWSGGLYGSIAGIDGVEIELDYTEYPSTDLVPEETVTLSLSLANPVITFITPTEVEVTVTDTLDPFEDFLYYVLSVSDTLTPVEIFSHISSDIVDVLEPTELFQYSDLAFGSLTDTITTVEIFNKTVERSDFLDYLDVTEIITTETLPAYGVTHVLVPVETIGHLEVGLIAGVEVLVASEGFVGFVDSGTCRIDRIYYPRSTQE